MKTGLPMTWIVFCKMIKNVNNIIENYPEIYIYLSISGKNAKDFKVSFFMKAKMPFPLSAALLSLRQRTILNVNTASLGIRKVSFPSHPPTPHLQYKCISTLISSHLNSLILNVNTASLGKKEKLKCFTSILLSPSCIHAKSRG